MRVLEENLVLHVGFVSLRNEFVGTVQPAGLLVQLMRISSWEQYIDSIQFKEASEFIEVKCKTQANRAND